MLEEYRFWALLRCRPRVFYLVSARNSITNDTAMPESIRKVWARCFQKRLALAWRKKYGFAVDLVAPPQVM